jgi:hypothetical protein
MEWLVSEPWGERGKVWGGKGKDFVTACIFEASGKPFVADGKAVGRKGGAMPPPHAGCGVVLPAVRGGVEGLEDLDGLDALLSKAAGVKS